MKQRNVHLIVVAAVFAIMLIGLSATASAVIPYEIQQPGTGQVISTTWYTFIIKVHNTSVTGCSIKILGLEDLWSNLVFDGQMPGEINLFSGSHDLGIDYHDNNVYPLMVRLCTVINNTTNCEVDYSKNVTILMPVPTTIPTTTANTTTTTTAVVVTTAATTTVKTTTAVVVTTNPTPTPVPTVPPGTRPQIVQECTARSNDRIKLYFDYIFEGKVSWWVYKQLPEGGETEVDHGERVVNNAGSVEITHKNLASIGGGQYRFRFDIEVLGIGNRTMIICDATSGRIESPAYSSLSLYFNYLSAEETETPHVVTTAVPPPATTAPPPQGGIDMMQLGMVLLLIAALLLAGLYFTGKDKGATRKIAGKIREKEEKIVYFDPDKVAESHYKEEM